MRTFEVIRLSCFAHYSSFSILPIKLPIFQVDNRVDVKRRCPDAPVQRYERLSRDGFRRGRGRSKKHWREVIRQDMTQFQLTKNMTLDRRLWRTRIRIVG